MIIILAMRPDSKLDLVMHVSVLIIMYFQLGSIFILSVFIVNLKVFHFGYKRTRYIKPND